MTNLKIVSLAGIAITGAVVSLLIEHQAELRLRAGDTLLRQQASQLAERAAEHQRLLLSRRHAVSDGHRTELASLRLEADALKKQTNDLAKALAKTSISRTPRSLSMPDTPPSGDDLPVSHEAAMLKMNEARNIASALESYASDHQGKFPSDLDQIASYLAKQNMVLSGSNRFDIIYQGSLDKLAGIPLGTVAVIRDQQTWPSPSGKMLRAYGMADGHGQIVSADDNFQSWESQHVILPPRPGQ